MSFSIPSSQSQHPVSAPAGNIYGTATSMHSQQPSLNGFGSFGGGFNGIPMQQQAQPIFSRPICSTRILLLSGFAPELKTRDILQVFSEWEDMAGGFRVKWIDDRSAYIVFQDALVAKKAFLATLSNMPTSLAGSLDNPAQPAAKLLPYTGPEADSILASIANRPRSRSISQQPLSNSQNGHNRRLSSSAGQSGHMRRTSVGGGTSFKNGPAPTAGRRESVDQGNGRPSFTGGMGSATSQDLPKSTDNMTKEQEEAVDTE